MSWRDFFRREPQRPPSPPSIRIVRLRLDDSPDNWHVGDKAVCVGGKPWAHCFTGERAIGPEEGDVCVVTNVDLNFGAQCLSFSEFGDRLYVAAYFQKLKPDEREACTEDFRKLLNRTPEKVDA